MSDFLTKPGCTVWLFVLLLWTQHADAQTTEPEPQQRFRESVSIESNSAVLKRINDAREYISGKKWQLAVDILHGMLLNGEQALVPLHTGLYVCAEQRCNLLLSQLPQDGRAVYRRKADPQAKAWYDAAMKGRDPAAMRRVVHRAFATSYGDDALFQLGTWAWERGDVTAARRYWRQILPLGDKADSRTVETTLRYPATDLDTAAIVARCILCDIVEGRFDRAEAAVAEFKRQSPTARGTIAGKTGTYAQILEGVLRDARTWNFSPADTDSTTFAGNNRRNMLYAPPEDVGARLWSRELDWKLLPIPDDNAGFKRRRHPASYPVGVDGVVYTAIADRVFAYNVQTGQPAFPTDADEKIPVENRAVVYPEVAGDASPKPIRETVGVPRFTVTVADGRLFARLGSPITGRTRDEVRAARSQLICYRLGTDTGELQWKVGAESFGRGWEFEGSPIVVDDRLYVAMRLRFPETQIWVACLNSRTGREIWKQRVCTALAIVGDEQNHVTHSLLSHADDSLFLSTNVGAIAALDTVDGTVRWLTTYETRRPRRLDDISNAMKTGFTPCLIAGGILVAAPTDSRELFGINPQTGVVQWSRILRGGVRHLLGAHGGRATATVAD
eukprot:g32980.t1